MISLRRATVVLSILFLAPAHGHATSFELGVLNGVEILDYDRGSNLTLLAFPLGRFAVSPSMLVGLFASDRVEIEPSFDLLFAASSNPNTYKEIRTGLAVLYHWHEGTPQTRAFLRAGVVAHAVDDVEWHTQGGVAFGIGVKIPIASHLYWRPEVRFTHMFEHRADRFPGVDVIGLHLGFAYENRGQHIEHL